MNVYIWERVERLTENYHDEGGAVIVAETIEAARKHLPEGCEAQYKHPAQVLPLADDITEERVYIFPDAGCC